ncbi:MAG: cytochrome C [Desulfobulbaceae bacterium]|uniref:Cytochrome C n=1 Tax=Candidatus Desulfobia pelagia TaxID=2841692 RepID=A0A8J6TG31_9BACT|nr:cytochrome C [Candidatus Desulfobia pelagia]
MSKKILRALLSLCTASLVFAGSVSAGEPHMKTDTDFYPYSPSLIKWDKSKADFNAPETCGECHPDQYEEWTASMHALAFKDPVYQGELNAAIKAVGHDIAKQCEGCHTPAAVVKGEIKGAGLTGLTPLAMAGVSCDVCHSISCHTHWQTPYHQPENGSFILSPGKNTEDGPVLTKYGPFTPEEGCGEDFHECVESPLHLTSELCASCHQVFHYKTHTPLEATYMEWKNSPYASNDIHCQDCHMVELDTFKRSADEMTRPKREEYRHYFNGANFLLYYLTELAAKKAGDEALAANAHSKFEMAVGRLQAAADVEVAPVYRDNKLAEIKVRVKNLRAGHNLPTSLTNVRQMWVEVTAKNSKGEIVMTTGTADAKGKLPENVRLLNSDGQNENFHFAIDPWEVQSFAKHDTIPPKGYKDLYYGISAEKGDPLSVEVKLRYRQADQKVAEKLLGLVPDDIHLDAIYGIKEVPILPVVDMVSKSVMINKADS